MVAFSKPMGRKKKRDVFQRNSEKSLFQIVSEGAGDKNSTETSQGGKDKENIVSTFLPLWLTTRN